MRKVGWAGLVGLALSFLVASSPAPGRKDGIRRAVPRRFVCGTDPELAARMHRQHRAAARDAVGAPESAADVDIGQVAVLFDAGNLVVFGSTDTTAIAQQFYATHPDDFDYLTIFVSSAYNFDVQIEAGFAFHRRVASDVLGIGIDPVDNAADLGLTTTRLRSILQLNDLLEYLPRFDDPLPQFAGSVEGVEILGQEAGHQFASFVDVGGEMLGRAGAHWSFFMSSEASVMEGNRWVEDGNDFLSVEAFEHYSQLDEYLMGLRDPAAVTEPIFVIQRPKMTGGRNASSPPEAGVRIGGNRQDITLAEIEGAEGFRFPDFSVAPHTFTMAVALVVPDGAAPPPGDLDRVESFRRTWVEWFQEETDGLGQIDTSLPGVAVSPGFELEAFAGAAPLTVSFRDRSLGPITSRLWDFGDGATSTDVDPVHVYDQPGFYTVQLTVDGPGGPAASIRPGAVIVQPFVERFHEDFEDDPVGWQISTPSTAISGLWLLDDPVGSSRAGIPGQPEDDATLDPGARCWVTGNAAPGDPVGANDVDGGTTTLRSAEYDLAGMVGPVVEYALWFSNDLGGAPGEDLWVLEASPDGGATWLPLDSTRRGDRVWRTRQVLLTGALIPTDQVRFRFLASDLGLGSLVEAAVDEFRILSLDGVPDRDGDGIPDPTDNCPDLAHINQQDVDGDGVGAPCDCDDLDPQAGLFPSTDLLLEADPVAPTRFTWAADPLAETYNVYKGILAAGQPFAYVQVCAGGEKTDPEFVDPNSPDPGGWFFYLVSGENICGEGGLGAATDGVPRPLSEPCGDLPIPGG